MFPRSTPCFRTGLNPSERIKQLIKNTMNEQRLLKLIGLLELDFARYTGKKFLNVEALEHGAKSCVSIRDSLDVYFDENGELVGTATTEPNSFRQTPAVTWLDLMR